MVKVVIGGSGIVESGGSGFDIAGGPGSKGVSPFQLNVKAVTAATTLTDGDAGVLTVSASDGANGTGLTVTMPAVSTVPGAMFIIRSLSPDAHTITGSADDASGGPGASGGEIFTDGTLIGQSIATEALAGTSVSLVSDGVSWLVLSSSGSLTYA